jgi:hypothetical protein
VVVSAIIGQALKQVKRKGVAALRRCADKLRTLRGHPADTARTKSGHFIKHATQIKQTLAQHLSMAYILQSVFLIRR